MHLLSFRDTETLISQPPPVDVPAIEKDEDSKDWTPFPLQGPSRPALTSSRTHARASLWKTASKISWLRERYKDNMGSDTHWLDALQLFEELQSRRRDLNGRLGVLHGAPPHVFSLQSVAAMILSSSGGF